MVKDPRAFFGRMEIINKKEARSSFPRSSFRRELTFLVVRKSINLIIIANPQTCDRCLYQSPENITALNACETNQIVRLSAGFTNIILREGMFC